MPERVRETRLNLDEMLDHIMQRLQEVIPFDSGGIVVYNADGQWLVPRRYVIAGVELSLPRLLHLGDGLIGQVATRRQAQRIADGDTADLLPYDSDSRAMLAVPMLLNDELFGVISVEARQANRYSALHEAMLTALADQAALAFHTARLYDTLAARYDWLEQANAQLLIRNEISRMTTSSEPGAQLWQHMALRLAELAGVDGCALVVWHEPLDTLRFIAVHGIDGLDRRDLPGDLALTGMPIDWGQIAHQTIERRAPLILNNAWTADLNDVPELENTTRAVLSMPLTARGRATGAAILVNNQSDRPFTQADVEHIAAALDQVALAVDNDRLLSDMQARLTETSTLLRMAEIASSGFDLEVMLQQVLVGCQQLLSASVCVILTPQSQPGILTVRPGSALGVSAEVIQAAHFPISDVTSQIATVFRTGAGLLTNNLMQTTDAAYRGLIRDGAINNMLLAPLLVQDESVGVIIAGGKRGDFNRNDLDLLTAIGAHIAAALQNADLLSQTKQRLSETEALQRIAAITSATLELDKMLEQAVLEAAQLLDAEGAFLLLPDSSHVWLLPHEQSLYGTMRAAPLQPLRIDDSGPLAAVYNAGQLYREPHLPLTRADPPLIVRNVVACPLSVRNRPLGILALVNRRIPDPETVPVELLWAIASQIAVSMQNAGLFAAERQRADLMSLINQIGQELTATLDLPGLSHKVVSSINELLGYEAACLYLLDEGGTMLIAQASSATTAEMRIADGFTFPVAQGIVGRAIRQRQTQLANDIFDDPDFFWPSNTHHIASDLVVLLRSRDAVLGAIEIYSSHPNDFREADRTALETLATQTSTAIENARLWDQAQRRLLEQSIVHQIGQDLTAILDYNELVNAVVRHMNRALDTSTCVLVAPDADQSPLLMTIQAEYRLSDLAAISPARRAGQKPEAIENTLIDHIVTTRRPSFYYREEALGQFGHTVPLDKPGLNAAMALPMIAGHRVTGCVLWLETRIFRRFSESDIRLAQTLTAQAAIAIENARLYRQAQRQAYEQALLRRVAVGLTVLSDMDAMLNHFVREVQQAFNAENVLLSLLDRQTFFQSFPIKARSLRTRPVEDTVLGRLEPQGGSVLKLLNSGQLVEASSRIINKTLSSAQRELAELMAGIRYTCVLAPIMQRNVLIGIIEVSRDNPQQPFDSSEIALLEALASQGAVAIDNAGLYEREQWRLRQLERTQVSSQVLASELQTERLFDLIVQEASTIFAVDAVSLLIPTALPARYLSQASRGLSDTFLAQSSLVNSLIRFDAPLSIPDLLQTDIFPAEHRALIEQEKLRTLLCVPINKTELHLAVLLLFTKEAARRFSDEEIELAQLFAGQAAVAVENAQLFAEVEQRAEELAKANKLKSEFLARVSHELRTPMNSINGYSEMLLLNRYGPVSEKQADRLGRILRNGKSLLALIDDLLDISKIDADKMEMHIEALTVDAELRAALESLEPQAAAHGLYLHTASTANLPRVLADPGRLKQILVNLIGNAIKFTKTGGITVETRLRTAGKQSAMIEMRVIDTGIGIRAEDQSIIFDEFRQVDGSATREYGGTGLGLAITRRLVEMMHGQIWVESEFGRGSAFTFTLPIALPYSKPTAEPSASESG